MVLARPHAVETEFLGKHRLFEVVAIEVRQRLRLARKGPDPRSEDDLHRCLRLPSAQSGPRASGPHAGGTPALPSNSPLFTAANSDVADAREHLLPEQLDPLHHRVGIARPGVGERYVDDADADLFAGLLDLLDDAVGPAAEADRQHPA